MKKILTLILLLPSVLWAQNAEEAKKLVDRGIRFHDKGLYPEAVEMYKEALAIDSTSGLIYYELAFTYFAMEKYEDAIATSQKVLALDERYGLEATNNIGNSLDMLGRREEAVEVFEEGIKKYGEDARLYFNLGIVYMGMERVEEGLAAYEQALFISPMHASSAYNLALYHFDNGEKGKGILSAYYFLLLEPTGDRSAEIYQRLAGAVGGTAQREGGHMTISLDADAMEEEFGMIEITLAASSIVNSSLDEERPNDSFLATTENIFATVGEAKKRKNKGLFWELFTPLFYSLSQSEHLEAYCHYIRFGHDEDSLAWVKAHPRELEEMAVFAESEIDRALGERK